MFTTSMWIISTVIFKFYLTYFARYDILYGNLSSIIIMLVWCYFLSYIFVLGMAINASNREQIEFLEETKKLALDDPFIEGIQLVIRKLAHFSVYAIGGFLIMNYAYTINKTRTGDSLP